MTATDNSTPDPGPPSPGPWRKILGLALLSVSGLVFALAIGEFLVVPTRLPDLPRDVLLMGFYGTPGLQVGDTTINSLGFSGDEMTVENPDNALRVLLLGGSVLFDRDLPHALSERLNALSRRPVQVLGAAFQGHTTRASLLKYRVLADYGFDVVFIYHGINDLPMNHIAEDEFRADYSHLCPWYRRGLLLDRSLTARLLFNASQPFEGYPPPTVAPKLHNAADFAACESFSRNIEELIALVRRHSAAPVLMTFAWNIPEHYSQMLVKANLAGYNCPDGCEMRVETWGTPDFVRRGLALHNNAVRHLAKTHKTDLLDQKKLMGTDLRLFTDVCHLSYDGIAVFTNSMALFMVEKGHLQPARPPHVAAATEPVALARELLAERSLASPERRPGPDRAAPLVAADFTEGINAFRTGEFGTALQHARSALDVCLAEVAGAKTAGLQPRWRPRAIGRLYWLAGAAAFNGLDFAAAEELAAAALDAKLGPEFWVMLACSQAKQGRKQNALASAAAGLAVIPGDQLLQQAAQWIESGSPDAPVKLQVSFAR